MVLQSLSDLESVDNRAIIINYNTKHVTFLSLLSALRYSDMPVLLIDCNSTDGSFEFFKSLQNRYRFDLINAPLKQHGQTLDWIFTSLNDKFLLLIDSDLEILNKTIIGLLTDYINDGSVFASGFIDGPGILTKGEFKGALFAERPFIPITLFRAKPVKEAISKGVSFLAALEKNENRFFRKLRVKTPQLLKKRYLTIYPDKVYYDTGAKMFEHLRYEKFLMFSSIPTFMMDKYVTHFWGATSKAINPAYSDTGKLIDSMNEIVLIRLKSEYSETI